MSTSGQVWTEAYQVVAAHSTTVFGKCGGLLRLFYCKCVKYMLFHIPNTLNKHKETCLYWQNVVNLMKNLNAIVPALVTEVDLII